MTVTLAPWEAWPLAALTVLGASTLASLATAAVLKRRAGGHPAPGAGPAPVPGETPAKAAYPPARPSPAPGPRHRTGGLSHTIRVWNCGCIHLHDSRGALAGCTPCTPASDLDEELKGLLS